MHVAAVDGYGVFFLLFYGRNNTKMRQFLDLPRGDDSSRFQQCPPSHHEMALLPHHVQASAQAPRPSQSTPPSTVLLAYVWGARCLRQPLRHLWYCIPLTAPCPSGAWEGDCTQAQSHNHSYGLLAPVPMSFGASTPTYSPHHLNKMGGGIFPNGSD